MLNVKDRERSEGEEKSVSNTSTQNN